MAGLFFLFLLACGGVAVASRDAAKIGLLALWGLAGISMIWGIGSALLGH